MTITILSSSGWLLATTVAALATLAALLVRHQFTFWRRHNIPFAAPSFPFGNFTDTFLQRRPFVAISRDLYHSTQEPVLGIWTLLQPAILLRSPQLIREVCIKNFANFADRGIYYDEKREPLSGHIFSLGGQKWRHLRAKLSPSFTSGKLRAMFSTVGESAAPLSRHLGRLVAEKPQGCRLEVRELAAQYTTNAIASAAFGLDIDCIAEPETPFRRFGRKALEPSVWHAVRDLVWAFFPRLFRLLRWRTVDADVTEFMMSVVQQNMELRERADEAEEAVVVRKDFFQLLVQLRNGGVQEDGVWRAERLAEGAKELSVEECAAQAYLFFIAGFETSASTMSFALYEMARNPEVQRRVQREIDEQLARSGGELSYEAVAEMRYLEWCLDETLRKYPPLPALNRSCLHDWHIPNSNMLVPAGTAVLIPVYALQMDPQYYPEPESFRPERFDPEHELFAADRPYLPFGDGPRICIGMRYGKMQTKVGLISMLREFWFEPVDDSKEPLVFNASSFVLTPVGGIQLNVRRREMQ